MDVPTLVRLVVPLVQAMDRRMQVFASKHADVTENSYG